MILRLQPPKNIKKFIRRRATDSVIKIYIGQHRVLFHDKKETILEDFLNEIEQPTIDEFLSLFPLEIQPEAERYYELKYANQS
jgi:hypothetical protein